MAKDKGTSSDGSMDGVSSEAGSSEAGSEYEAVSSASEEKAPKPNKRKAAAAGKCWRSLPRRLPPAPRALLPAVPRPGSRLTA